MQRRVKASLNVEPDESFTSCHPCSGEGLFFPDLQGKGPKDENEQKRSESGINRTIVLTFLRDKLPLCSPVLESLLPLIDEWTGERVVLDECLPHHLLVHVNWIPRVELRTDERVGEVSETCPEVERIVGSVENGRLEAGEVCETGDGCWFYRHCWWWLLAETSSSPKSTWLQTSTPQA